MKKKLFNQYKPFFILFILVIPLLMSFKMQDTTTIQFYKNIKVSDIKDCSLYRELGSESYHIKLSQDEFNKTISLLKSSKNIVNLPTSMPSSYNTYWIYINLKSNKQLKLMIVKGGFCFQEKGFAYRIVQLQCKDFRDEISNKYLDIPPDICNSPYITNLFSNYGMNLNTTNGYHLALNKTYGSYYYCNNDLDSKIIIYTYPSNQEMTKGLKEFNIKSCLLEYSYHKVYSVKNIIIIALGENSNKYDYYIGSLVDYINGKSDNLFPIDSYKILDTIGNLDLYANFGYTPFAITTFKSNKIVSELYNVKYNDVLNLTVTNGEEFVISFSYSGGSPFIWNLVNYPYDGMVRFDKENIFFNKQNYYFKAPDNGSQKLFFRCEPRPFYKNQDIYPKLEKDAFGITLNINTKHN